MFFEVANVNFLLNCALEQFDTASMKKLEHIPLIDISALRLGGNTQKVAEQIRDACTNHGFFYVKGHGVCPKLQAKLEDLSNAFFNLPTEQKMEIAMAKGGKAWRGYFPVGNELTSGKPDQKEGIYFGTELASNHPKVKQGVPLHGKNLFPTQIEDYKNVVLTYMHQVTQVGHAIMRGVALSLSLPAHYFEASITKNPFVLFRVFHYPKQENTTEKWGVGEHTDYGLLTILKQDNVGGLQIKSNQEWIAAPPVENTFICNIGDMLDRMTGGRYLSTPHRVLNTSGKSRLSFPLFFDPDFDAQIHPIPNAAHPGQDATSRWDHQNVYNFEGKYGAYLTKKVAQVFPKLFQAV